ncbi:carph-isopro domain-containing protein [Pedomonas sp. V897]|uniref:carph-isopro domain-containing protein n=1 Tax=Pedomonas sp. V897 TaxID=3446482 RepID=UPI003EDFB755
MQTEAALMIDELGGTTAVARAIGVPVSTVHSWRKNGIPHWRHDAIQKLASKKRARRKTAKVSPGHCPAGTLRRRASSAVSGFIDQHSNLHSSKTGGAQ